jgi:putative ABC transport system ATP-binding protein
VSTGREGAPSDLYGELSSLYVEPERAQAEIEWPALQFLDVFKIFRSGNVETVALRGLDLRVERGELVAILGPSGCGKSTMLSLAAAFDHPSAGEVRAGERPLTQLDEAALAAYRAQEVALVLQRDNLWPWLTARENVALSLRLSGRRDSGAAAEEALGAFGLEARRTHRAATLSGGEQQRVAIAAAAARRAPLVLADEPTGELDAANERSVLAALRELCESFAGTVVVVTHSPAVARAADRVIEMRDGRALP